MILENSSDYIEKQLISHLHKNKKQIKESNLEREKRKEKEKTKKNIQLQWPLELRNESP